MKEVKLIHNGKEYTVQMEDNNLKELIGEKVRLRPEKKEDYFLVDTDGHISDKVAENMYLMEAHWGIGLAFFTKEEAERTLEIMKAKQRIRDYVKEQGMEFSPDWENDDQEKYFVFYSHNRDELDIDYYYEWKRESTVCFASREHARQCIRDCEDDWKIIFEKYDTHA